MPRIAVGLPRAARVLRVTGLLAVLALAVAAQDGQRPSAPPLARTLDLARRLVAAPQGSPRAAFHRPGTLGIGAGPDCNANGVPDDQDIASGASADCDGNGVPDECEADCDADGIVDDGDGPDCNGNLAPDNCDISAGVSQDCNANGVPDECEPDCDGDGIPDVCDGPDCNGNGLPDNCDVDGA